MSSAAWFSLSGLAALAHAPPQLLEPSLLLRPTFSREQLAFQLQKMLCVEDELRHAHSSVDTTANVISWKMQEVQLGQEWMATLAVGEEGWRAGLDWLRQQLRESCEAREIIKLTVSRALQQAQHHLDAVHAVFALPEVERTTDLLPELIGIVGEFLSIDTIPSRYVSIHALPKASQPSATGTASDLEFSSVSPPFSSIFPKLEAEDGSNLEDEAKEDDESESKDE